MGSIEQRIGEAGRASRRGAALGVAGALGTALLLLGACGGTKKDPAQLAAVDADLGLGDVVMMTWTTREAAGLLGHALSAGELSVDPHRRAMTGAEHFVPTDQTLSIVVSRDHTASVGAKYGPVGGQAEGAATTHVAYEVRITGYLELGPTDLRYRAESGCCAGGALSGSCGDYYVMRLMRGSGKAEYLQKLEGKMSVSAVDVVHASGGTAFRKLSTSRFDDTYFAYELAPLEGVCALLTPDEEMVPMQVAARDNCFLTAYQDNGTRVAEGWHLPDARLCWHVAEKHSHQIESLLEFHVRFASNDGTRTLSAADAAKVDPDAIKGAPEVRLASESAAAVAVRAPVGGSQTGSPPGETGSPPAVAGAPSPSPTPEATARSQTPPRSEASAAATTTSTTAARSAGARGTSRAGSTSASSGAAPGSR